MMDDFTHTNATFFQIQAKDHYIKAKGTYNRLPLIMSYLLDIDFTLSSLLFPWEVKFNKSWNTIFAIELWIHIHNNIQTLATLQCQFHHIMVLY